MSIVLYKFAVSFINERISADKFADSYQELWRIERDLGLLKCDKDDLSEVLSTIFCLADLFNPNTDRKEYELNESALRTQIKEKLDLLSI